VQSAVSTFPSDKWIPHIQKVCGEFHSLISKNCPGGHYLIYRDGIGTIEKPGRIVKDYHRIASLLKIEVFGQNAYQSRINHHKIIALYIRSFLIYKPFLLKLPDPTKYYKTCQYTQFPNEYFLIDYIETIIRAANNDTNGELLIDPARLEEFIKLLYEYKNDISKLHPITLSQIIQQIELLYFRPSRPQN
jgi:hypothetical protein